MADDLARLRREFPAWRIEWDDCRPPGQHCGCRGVTRLAGPVRDGGGG